MSEAVEPLLPERMTLRNSAREWLWGIAALILAGVLLFNQIPADMVTPVDGQKTRWAVVIVFSLLVIFSFLRGRRRLELDPEGFTESTLLESTRRKWRDCSNFELDSIGNRPKIFFVCYTLADYGDAKLTSSYGLGLEALAGLMNQFRARALGNAA